MSGETFFSARFSFALFSLLLDFIDAGSFKRFEDFLRVLLLLGCQVGFKSGRVLGRALGRYLFGDIQLESKKSECGVSAATI